MDTQPPRLVPTPRHGKVVPIRRKAPDATLLIEAHDLAAAAVSWWKIGSANDCALVWGQISDWCHGAGCVAQPPLAGVEFYALGELAMGRYEAARERERQV